MTKPLAQRLIRQHGGSLRTIPGVWRRKTGWWIKINYVVDLPDGSIRV